MNFDLSEDQELFKATVERFCEASDVELRRKIRKMDGAYDRSRWSELAELGLIALAASEEGGGMGGSDVDLCVIGQALGAGNALDPWLENGVLPAKLLAAAGEQEHLPGVLDGSAFAAVAFAERNQRFNLAAEGVTAKKDGDGFKLVGEKTYVQGGAIADIFVISAKLDDGSTGWFVLPADTRGLHVSPYRLADGSLGAELQLHDVQVAASAHLDISADQLANVVAEVKLLAAAEMAGLAGMLLNDTLEYVRQREQFGVAIGTFQALQHRLVECYAALEQGQSMLWRGALADRADANAWIKQISGVKAFVADQAMHIGREAVQMHGGMGVTDELAIGHALKRVMMLEKTFGDTHHDLNYYSEAA